MTTQSDTTVPDSGWMTDLTTKQLEVLIGTMVTVISGARAATGLLIAIEDGTARIFNERYAKPAEYAVHSTNYERVPGTPRRPALAAAIAYQLLWDEQYEALTVNGDAKNIRDYDKARGAWEDGLAEVYEPLMEESRRLLFGVIGEEVRG